MVCKIITTARSDFGVITSTGRLIRCLGAGSADRAEHGQFAPNLQGGAHVSELINLDPASECSG